MTKISQKTREQAALICAVAASNPALERGFGYEPIRRELGFGYIAYDVANAAWGHANQYENSSLVNAEAEALLRTGWCPGD